MALHNAASECTAFKAIRTTLLAAAIATGGVSYAVAQSAPAPANQSGGVNATPGMQTDPGSAGASGNTKATPTPRARKDGSRMTTGSGASQSKMRPANSARPNAAGSTTTKPGSANHPATRSMQKNPSPASPDSGTQPVR